ncbi:MAG: ATP-grasp domain-containing protein, partial [Anaerolineae bacterium]|nr:ATP-grasp domain-containing protein [Anaerolineae bacterium]
AKVVFPNGEPMLLIEQFVEGVSKYPTALPYGVGEVSVEGFESGGFVQIIAIHDKPLPTNGPYFEEVCWSTPSRLPQHIITDLHRQTKLVVRGLQIKDSFFHIEFRIAENRNVLLEAAARMGGGPIYRSVLESQGINMLEIMTSIATRQPIHLEERPVNQGTPILTIGLFADAGVLASIQGLQEVETMKGVVELVQYDPIGTFINRAPTSTHCTLHIMIRGSSFDEAEKIAIECINRIKFETIINRRAWLL